MNFYIIPFAVRKATRTAMDCNIFIAYLTPASTPDKEYFIQALRHLHIQGSRLMGSHEPFNIHTGMAEERSKRHSILFIQFHLRSVPEVSIVTCYTPLAKFSMIGYFPRNRKKVEKAFSNTRTI